MTKSTLRLTSNRSFALLSEAVKQINENLYSTDLMSEDRVELIVGRDQDGEVTHYELVGDSLDFFQIGLRYGLMEERELLKSMGSGMRDILLGTKPL